MVTRIIDGNNANRLMLLESEDGGELLTARNSAQGVVIRAPSGAVIPLDPAQGVLLVGDSRSMFGTYPESVSYFNPISISDLKGLPIVQLGAGPGDLDYNTTRQMLYRAVDRSVQWPDAAGNYGPWTPLQLGVTKIESGTAGKWVVILVRSLALMPTTDQTVPVVVTQSPYATETYVTPSLRAARALRLPTKYCGASGGRLQEMEELLPWYKSQAAGCGYFIFRAGTNNISADDASLEYMIGKAKIVLDGLLGLGLRGVVVGETARWGTAVGTPLTASKFAILCGYNKWLYGYCAAQSDSLRYVDAWSLTVDTDYTDGRPLAGMLSDTVHDAEAGSAVALTYPIINALTSLGAAERPAASHGDPSNLLAGGWMMGTGGTLNTGVTGIIPDLWEAARKSGADATIASSIEQRTDKAGKFWRCDITTVAGSQVLRLNTTYANRQLISTLNKVAGDSIRLECDFQLAVTSGSLAAACTIYFQMWTGGSSIILRSQAKVVAPGLYKIITPDITIPIGVTMIQPYIEIFPAANSALTVKVGDMFIK